jgi:hypothetical protein
MLSSIGPLLEIQTNPTDFARILEISFSVPANPTTGNAVTIGVGVPAALGTMLRVANPIIENTFIADTTGVTIGVDWSIPPTIPTNFLRRWTSGMGGTATAGFEPVKFRFPRGLVMPPSSSIVVWAIAIAAGAAANGCVFDPVVVLDA